MLLFQPKPLPSVPLQQLISTTQQYTGSTARPALITVTHHPSITITSLTVCVLHQYSTYCAILYVFHLHLLSPGKWQVAVILLLSCILFYPTPLYHLLTSYSDIIFLQSTLPANLLRIRVPFHLPYIISSTLFIIYFMVQFYFFWIYLIYSTTQNPHLPQNAIYLILSPIPNISFYSPDTLFPLHYVPSHGQSYLIIPQKNS